MNQLEQRYNETLDYIYSFISNSLTHQPNLSLDDTDLTNMVSLVQSLGDPQQKFPSIHVAGSKGKGSVSAFCAAALQAEGYKVGLYTSPHLRDFEERIQINRQPISKSDFIELIDEIKPFVERLPGLNTFEIATAAAFWFFAQQKVDIAVIEVGLGGRLDATNVIVPKISVITALYLEHTAILGDTLSKIAFEKAGIIKPGIPIVLSPQRPEALEVVARIASERNAPFIQMGLDHCFEPLESSLDGQIFKLTTPATGEHLELEISLLGLHQIENASTAYIALRKLREQGISLSEDAIHEGFADAKWAARFEVLRRDPPIVVDSAHNPDSARRLRETLGAYFPGRSIVLVLGVSEDKDISGIIAELVQGTELVICTQSTHPRAMDTKKLMELMQPFGIPTKARDNVGDALQLAMQEASENAVIIVTGSIFVAASARIAWFELFAD